MKRQSESPLCLGPAVFAELLRTFTLFTPSKVGVSSVVIRVHRGAKNVTYMIVYETESQEVLKVQYGSILKYIKCREGL